MPLSPQPKSILIAIPIARSISAVSYHLSLSRFSHTSFAISPSLPSHAKEEKSKTDQAKELLAKYGGAYLAMSSSLSLISFSLCYLLARISTNETGEKVGTFALAYATHKAASPIRFPTTVALTPIVANWIGKKMKGESDKS